MNLDTDLEPNPALVLETSMRFVSEKHNGLMLPYVLFPLLKDILGFDKGGLLLKRGTDHTFIGSSFANFDISTHHKLRLSALQANAFKKPKIYSGELLSGLKPLFSSTDFETLKNLSICPCYAGVEVEAILVMSNSPYTELEPKETEHSLHAISIIIGQALSKQRLIPKKSAKVSLGVHQNLHIETGKMAQAISANFLYSSALSIELDLSHHLSLYLDPYTPIYDPKTRSISAKNLPNNPSDIKLLLEGIIDILKEDLSLKDLKTINFQNFIRQ